MFMLLILAFLPDRLSSPPPELLEAFLELLVLLFLLLFLAPLPFGVESFSGAPFLLGEGFDLTSEEEHHVRIG